MITRINIMLQDQSESIEEDWKGKRKEGRKKQRAYRKQEGNNAD